jgi:DNA-directed RNA polymerase subunit RPC12/RpoP
VSEPAPITLSFACPRCGAAVEGSPAAGTASLRCPACSADVPLPEAAEVAASRRAHVCPVCGSRDLYQQRDFNRALGLSLAGVGLVLGPFTHWISTVVAIAIDAALYLVVPSVAVCYACEAQQRGFSRKDGPPPFDIAVFDAYKFGKRFPPRREAAVAGPLARRLRREGKDR